MGLRRSISKIDLEIGLDIWKSQKSGQPGYFQPACWKSIWAWAWKSRYPPFPDVQHFHPLRGVGLRWRSAAGPGAVAAPEARIPGSGCSRIKQHPHAKKGSTVPSDCAAPRYDRSAIVAGDRNAARGRRTRRYRLPSFIVPHSHRASACEVEGEAATAHTTPCSLSWSARPRTALIPTVRCGRPEGWQS